MSYFGGYNGGFFASWWGGLVEYIEGKARSLVTILWNTASEIRQAGAVLGIYSPLVKSGAAVATVDSGAQSSQSMANLLAASALTDSLAAGASTVIKSNTATAGTSTTSASSEIETATTRANHVV